MMVARTLFICVQSGFLFAVAVGVASAQVPTPAPATSTLASPSAAPSGLPESPDITALAARWVQRLQARPAADLRPMMLQDGPVTVIAAGVLAGQGDPVSVKYAGGSPPGGRVPLYTYLYDFHFAHSNVREILMIDGSGNVHQILFASDHPF